jgi:glycosyltransferase involved in cell wall biosynthesis
MKKICIVTTRHISYNPRVLKEADTLSANGYEVTVVTVNSHIDQARFDEELMRSRPWSLRSVDFRKAGGKEERRWFYFSLKQKVFGFLSRFSCRAGIAERAAEKSFDSLVRLAKAIKADLYLVHHPEALGVGFSAARHNRAKFGFDAEDFHSGMNEPPAPADPLVLFLEKKYLPHCHYLTAASEGIARAYAGKYNIAKPVTILNTFKSSIPDQKTWPRDANPPVFPKAKLEPATIGPSFDKPSTPDQNTSPRKASLPVKFYWYSQVIGPNRGLETLLEAAGQINAGQIKLPFEIHLRGSFNNENYKTALFELVKKTQLEGKVFFHTPILSENIIRDGSNFDIGLALESNISINRNLCVTNKVFSYLSSGLAIIGTDTDGQKEIFSHFPGAVRICGIDNKEDLATAMLFYICHPEKLEDAKRAAQKAAATRFNWEQESQKLLTNINSYLV